MKLPRPRLTYANVISTLCLFLLLGGAAYAATTLPANSVGARQLRKRAVTPAKLSPAAVKALSGTAGPEGPRGPKGDNGDRGEPGLQGLTGSVGPTEGFSIGRTPGAEENRLAEESITLHHPGRLYVLGRTPSLKQECSAGAFAEVGLYLDGTPVSSSGEVLTLNVFTPIDLWGLSGTVAAGKHTITLGSRCEEGSGVASYAEVSLGAILLGS
jgi:hypothetical protein